MGNSVSEIELNGAYQSAVKEALDDINASDVLKRKSHILLKPNLINTSKPPVTTPADCIAAVIAYIRNYVPEARITIAEGCGAMDAETPDIFEALGYAQLAQEENVDLIDLNYEKTEALTDTSCSIFQEFHLPSIARGTFIISVPVLKAHTIAGVTLTMKNMLGFAPPAFYDAGSWKKSAFHSNIQEKILDLNRYRAADLTVLDAATGLLHGHLGGNTCSPPVNRILASFDPVAVDAHGCSILGKDPRKIPHIAWADGLLGEIST